MKCSIQLRLRHTVHCRQAGSTPAHRRWSMLSRPRAHEPHNPADIRLRPLSPATAKPVQSRRSAAAAGAVCLEGQPSSGSHSSPTRNSAATTTSLDQAPTLQVHCKHRHGQRPRHRQNTETHTHTSTRTRTQTVASLTQTRVACRVC